MNAMKRTVVCAAAALCALLSFGASDTFGTWAKDVALKDGKATWKTGKLATYAATYQKKIDKDASNYEARILHAATLLAQLGENATFQSYVKKFGYTIDYLKMRTKGKLAATSKWPSVNDMVDAAVKESVPVLKNAIKDLEAIPTTWTGTVLLKKSAYPVDENTYVDIGDILYARAALKSLLGLLYFAQGYDLATDWAKAKASYGYRSTIPVLAQAPSMKSDDGWQGALTSDGSMLAFAGSSLYFRMPLPEVANIENPLENLHVTLECVKGGAGGAAAGDSFVFYLEDENSFLGGEPSYTMSIWGGIDGEQETESFSVEVDAENRTVTLAIDLDGLEVQPAVGGWAVPYAGAGVRMEWVPAEYEYEFYRGQWTCCYPYLEFGDELDGFWKFFAEQTKFAAKVRTPKALSTSRSWMKKALTDVLAADAKVAARGEDGKMHFVEYDPVDNKRIANARTVTQNALKSINGDVSVDKGVWSAALGVDFTTLLPDGEMMRVYLGALFDGSLTRASVPELSADGPVALFVDALTDKNVTLGGILPDFTASAWETFAGMHNFSIGRKYGTLMVEIEGDGSVSGLKSRYVAGKTATLTATANAGSAFVGWVGEDGLISQDATLKHVTANPAADEWLAAIFVSAAEDELNLDMYLDDYADPGDEVYGEVYVESVSAVTVTVKGLPKGLTFSYDAKSGVGEITGTIASKTDGFYNVTVTAKNGNGYTDTRIVRMAVGSATEDESNKAYVATVYDGENDEGDPEQVFEEGFILDDLKMGEPFDRQQYRVGKSGWKVTKVTVSGLPSGLKAYCEVADDYGWFLLSGVPSKAGVFTVTVTATVGKKSYSTVKTVVVQGAGSCYVPPAALSAESEGMGTVSGGGVKSIGKTLTFKAVPASADYVFAGWFTDMALTVPVDEAVFGDYRTATLSLPLTEDVASAVPESGFFARFVHLRDDSLVLEESEEVDVEVGEELELHVEVETQSRPFVTAVKGLPAGVTFDSATWTFQGAPTAEGWYYPTVAATNVGGYSFTQVFPICVGGAELPDIDEISEAYLPWWCARNGYQPDEETGEYDEDAIDAFEAETGFWMFDGLEVGTVTYGDLLGMCRYLESYNGSSMHVTVSGLPSGLKHISEWGQSFVKGTPTKVGRYTIKITAPDPYDESVTLTKIMTVIVRDAPSRYVTVRSESTKKGTVTGSGVYHPGKTFKVTATPKKKCYFVGWQYWGKVYGCETCGESESRWMFASDVNDEYMWNPSTKFVLEDYLSDELVAQFATAAEDKEYGVTIDAEGDWHIEAYKGEYDSYWFWVDSLSKPTVTVKGLPDGTALGYEYGEWMLQVTNPKKLKPGIYTATITVVNESGVKATQKVRIFTPNTTTAVDKKVIKGLRTDTWGYGYDSGDYMMMATLPQSFKLADLGISAKSGWTINVTGLPKGWSYNAKKGTISGTTAATGPVLVTFTATKGSTSYKATATFDIAPFPEWAVGTFYGSAIGRSVGDDDWVSAMLFKATVKNTGKMTIKFTEPGVGSVSRTSQISKVDKDGNLVFAIDWTDGKKGKAGYDKGSATGTISLRGSRPYSKGNSYGLLEMKGSGVCDEDNDPYTLEVSATEDIWAELGDNCLVFNDEDNELMVPVGLADGTLALKFGAKGAVKAVWTNPDLDEGAVKPSCSTRAEIVGAGYGERNLRVWTAFEDEEYGSIGFLLNFWVGGNPISASEIEIEKVFTVAQGYVDPS